MNTIAQKAISVRWAAKAHDTDTVTIATSLQKLAPTRPILFSWRTRLTAALNASEWITIVHRTATVPTANGGRTRISALFVWDCHPTMLDLPRPGQHRRQPPSHRGSIPGEDRTRRPRSRPRRLRRGCLPAYGASEGSA